MGLAIPVLIVALLLAVASSLTLGANPVGIRAIWDGMLAADDTEASTIVWTLRAPRTVLGIAAGAAFGIAGALIQALTRNPLADAGILGVNAGAGFAVTIGVGATGAATAGGYVWFAFVGAAAATIVVYLIGSSGRGSASPVTLVLAGVALSAVLGGASTFLTLIDDDTFRSVRNWGIGSLSRTPIDDTLAVLPFLLIGVTIAVLIAGPLNSLALGDDLATSLGTRIVAIRILGIFAVTLLAGGATALTGGIGFIGLMVPHIVRWFVGPDQRRILLYSAVAAPAVVLATDVIGRLIARPGEIEVGILTAVIGAPVLIALVHRRGVSGL